MKIHLKLAPALLLALCFVGCGKKANETNKSVLDKSIGPSSAEIYFHGLQDLKKALWYLERKINNLEKNN
jgi:hypothetical protein